MSRQESLTLEQLSESYQVIGELGGRRDARVFMGRRIADGLDVLIIVARAPEGDEGNALNHLAADSNLLVSAGRAHRNLLHMVEGRWVGTDAFALVTERVSAPTLDELLSRRDEEFGFARIAAILQEANMVLEWARSQKVVHRSITPETLYLEPGSDRVYVSFAIAPLGAGGVPGPEMDARTIASLARAMLTRSPAAPERAALPLSELRPGLPASLVAETEALLQPAAGAKLPDVTAYIARIAMAEALKSAEEHLEIAKNAIAENERLHKEQIAKERREHEEQLAAERKAHEQQVAEQAKKVTGEQRTHEQQVADQAKKFAKEREEFERELAKERKALAREREALAKERASHAKERESHARDREALLQERSAHARDRAALLEERAAHERLTQLQREQLETEAAELESQAQLYAQTAEIEIAHGEALALEQKRTSSVAAATQPVVAPAPRPRPSVAKTSRRSFGSGVRAWTRKWKREWNVPAVAAGLVLLLGVTALAIGRSHDGASGQPARVASGLVLDSAGGAVFPSVVPMPTTPIDSVKLVADSIAFAQAQADSAEARRARRERAARRAAEAEAAAREEAALRATFIQQPERPVRVDSAAPVIRDTTVKPDSAARLLVPAPPRRDSVPKADSLVKRDSTARR
jgi:hypothetical protein